jgi:alpha-tubulin suppressor-like RCC1 family protein
MDSAVPVQVEGITSGATSVSVGWPAGDDVTGNPSACAITGGGNVQCWGDDDLGQLGDGQTLPSRVPVTALKGGATAVSVGRAFTCAVVDANVYCWGDDDLGQLGIAGGGCSTVSAAAAMSGYASYCDSAVLAEMGHFVSVSASDGYACAVATGGGVDCWGDNAAGQLGDTTTKDTGNPQMITGL